MNIVFDLDGTLIDSARDIQSMTVTLLSQRGMEGLTLAETRSFIGEGSAVFVQRMMAARGIEETAARFEELHGKFLTLYAGAVDKAVFYPGAWDALAALRNNRHGLGLCTNKPEHATRAVLHHMGMASLFEVVMAGGMIASRKPEPAMLLSTIERLGGGPALYVGDSETDAECARRAGVPFALFSGGYRKVPASDIHHDWLFHDFAELETLVARLQ